jgi:hypothetical protein
MSNFQDIVVDYVENKGYGRSWTKIGRELGEDPERVRSAYRRYEGTHSPDDEPEEKWNKNDDTTSDEPPKSDHEQVNFDVYGMGATASSRSTRIKTLEQLIEACDIDLNTWRVDRHIINKWEIARRAEEKDIEYHMGRMNGYSRDTGKMHVQNLFQVKAWLVPRKEQPFESAIDDLIDNLRNYAPNYDPPPIYVDDNPHLFVPNIYDLHLGKISTDGTHTVESVGEDFLQAARALAGKARSSNKKIKRILIPVGQDILHVDTMNGTTTKGTWLEVSADIRRIVNVVCDIVPQAIEIFANIAPVHVYVIESNHDRYGAYWLGKMLEARFAHHPAVSVNVNESEFNPRSYYRFGKNLIGMEHGDKVRPGDLALTMATEAPQMWADSEYRMWLRGHLHKRQGMLHFVTEDKGVVARTIPALCPTDNYHQLRAYVGNKRAAEGLYFHEQYGPSGEDVVFID